jgi:hypothetical protein
VLAATSVVALLPTSAYERELDSRTIRETYFLAEDGSGLESFFADYRRTFPGRQGVCVTRIEVTTPFKAMVKRASDALPGYDPIRAAEEYKRQPPPFAVEVTLEVPNIEGPIPEGTEGYTDYKPDFWQEFEISLEQEGEVRALARRGRPLYRTYPPRKTGERGTAALVGAVVRVIYHPDQVASQPTRIIVAGPGGVHTEAEFDLARLR